MPDQATVLVRVVDRFPAYHELQLQTEARQQIRFTFLVDDDLDIFHATFDQRPGDHERLFNVTSKISAQVFRSY